MHFRDEAGTGLVSSIAGLAVFLGLLLLAAHVLLHLFATSVGTAAAFDAARVIAGSDGGSAAQERALAQARAVVGRWQDSVEFTVVHIGEDAVAVRVRGQAPPLLPAAVRRSTGLGLVDRTVRVRTERWIPDGG